MMSRRVFIWLGLLSATASLSAILLPTVKDRIYVSKFSEATDGLRRIAEASQKYASHHSLTFPHSAPLTPANVPKGIMAIDPPGTWDHPTWLALEFSPIKEGLPHLFSFEYENHVTWFSAKAHADLDGDGTTSTFEIRGYIKNRQVEIDPALYIDSEFE